MWEKTDLLVFIDSKGTDSFNNVCDIKGKLLYPYWKISNKSWKRTTVLSLCPTVSWKCPTVVNSCRTIVLPTLGNVRLPKVTAGQMSDHEFLLGKTLFKWLELKWNDKYFAKEHEKFDLLHQVRCTCQSWQTLAMKIYPQNSSLVWFCSKTAP